MPPLRLLLPLVLSLLLAGCEKKKTTLPPLPAPPPTPVARIEAPMQKERLSVDEAMTVKDVAFALRAGTPETELVVEIARRGVVERLSDAATKELVAAGAAPGVVNALQDPRNILTAAEKARFAERAAHRGKR